MNKRFALPLIYLAVSLLVPSFAFAAEGDLIWSKTWNPNPSPIGFFSGASAGIASDVYVDASGSYFVGGGPTVGNFGFAPNGSWGIEKRDLSTGNLIWQDTEVPPGAFATANDVVITGDGGSYIFIAGRVVTSNGDAWAVQKLDANTGVVIWSVVEPWGGVVGVASIAYEGSSLYVAGTYGNTSYTSDVSRVQKLSAVDGSVIWDQQYNTYPCSYSGGVGAMKVDSSGVYVASMKQNCATFTPNYGFPWLVEKKSLVDGSDIWSQTQSASPGYFYIPLTIETDGNTVYTGGNRFTCWNGGGAYDAYLEMRNESNGALIGSTVNSGSCATAWNTISSLKYFAGNLYSTQQINGSLTLEKISTNGGSVLWSKLIASANGFLGLPRIVIDNASPTSLYLAGAEYLGPAPGFQSSYWEWLMEKRGPLFSTAPSTPTISCPISATVGQPASFTLSNGTDPSNLSIRYGIDWLNSGSVGEWLPASGYVPSGTPETTTYTWTAPGTYTVRALTENSTGADSPWASCTVPVVSGPTNGSCAPTHYSCTAGTSANNASGASAWTWQCAGANGGTTASCSEQKPPTSVSFTCGKTLATSASSCTVNSGQPINLYWSSSPSGASCTSPGFSAAGGSPVSTGPLFTNPTLYSLTCVGPNNAPSTVNVTVNVNQPNVSITANPDRVNVGDTSTISWTSSLVNSCTVTGPTSNTLFSTKANNPGGTKVTINSQSVYTISCTVNGTPYSASTTVNILPKFNEF